MKFNIKKLYIWYGRDVDEHTVLEFDKNTVNVIRGDSSTGKSNILAILDYCLLSAKVNIVYPVINQYADWYGLEVEINGKQFAIARKKVDAMVVSDGCYMIYESFAKDFYPQNDNKQINQARTELDIAFGYHKEYPNQSIGEFRDTLVFNALTESIITSPYMYLNYDFFYRDWSDDKNLKDSIFAKALANNQNEFTNITTERKALLTKKNKAESEVRNIGGATALLDEMLESLLCNAISNGILDASVRELTIEEKISILNELAKAYTPEEKSQKDEALIQSKELRKKIATLSLQLQNMRNAKDEAINYIKTLADYKDSLIPYEKLRDLLESDGYGYNAWYAHILKSLNQSLDNIDKSMHKVADNPLYDAKQIKALEDDISKLKDEYMQLSKLKVQPETENVGSYVAGRILTMMPQIVEQYKKSQKVRKVFFSQEDELQLAIYDRMFETMQQNTFANMLNIETYFQAVFDGLKYMEHYEKCHTKFNDKNYRLELNDGRSILNYDVIGSQSNYMFMHLCFFLGLHTYMVDNDNPYIGRFLFIDQPSIPYYTGKNDVQSNDETKLKDAFKAINDFMIKIVEDKKTDFQIVLIEHAPSSYWEDLKYFKTKKEFKIGEALVPESIIEINTRKNEG